MAHAARMHVDVKYCRRRCANSSRRYAGTGGGANKLAREVTDALATMPPAVEAIAGKEMVSARGLPL